MLTRKAAAAIAAGCTVVAHPSHETPYSALALAELAERAGFEPGVFNIVTGRASVVVEPWTKDHRVRALSFTGSTEIGRLLYRQSADTVKKLVLELGGHAPFIAFDDCDVDYVVAEAIKQSLPRQVRIVWAPIASTSTTKSMMSFVKNSPLQPKSSAWALAWMTQ